MPRVTTRSPGARGEARADVGLLRRQRQPASRRSGGVGEDHRRSHLGPELRRAWRPRAVSERCGGSRLRLASEPVWAPAVIGRAHIAGTVAVGHTVTCDVHWLVKPTRNLNYGFLIDGFQKQDGPRPTFTLRVPSGARRSRAPRRVRPSAGAAERPGSRRPASWRLRWVTMTGTHDGRAPRAGESCVRPADPSWRGRTAKFLGVTSWGRHDARPRRPAHASGDEPGYRAPPVSDRTSPDSTPTRTETGHEGRTTIDTIAAARRARASSPPDSDIGRRSRSPDQPQTRKRTGCPNAGRRVLDTSTRTTHAQLHRQRTLHQRHSAPRSRRQRPPHAHDRPAPQLRRQRRWPFSSRARGRDPRVMCLNHDRALRPA